MRPLISSALILRVMREVPIASRIDGTAGPPDEKCGILRGRGHHVLRADRTRNVAADPFTRFEINPAELIRAYRLGRRAGGLEVMGWYHTHPTGSWDPSAEDAACAQPDGKLWLIASRQGARLWRAVEGGERHGRFDPVAFDVVIGSRVERHVPGMVWRGWDAEVQAVIAEPPRWSDEP